MAQTKDLAEILSKRNAEKYKQIIDRAALHGYHDHKFDKIPAHPEYGKCICPKMQLVQDLSHFQELNDIRQEVMDGKYDEPADKEDQEEMIGWLMDDNSPDEHEFVDSKPMPISSDIVSKLREMNPYKDARSSDSVNLDRSFIWHKAVFFLQTILNEQGKKGKREMRKSRLLAGSICKLSEEGKKSIKRMGNNHSRTGVIMRETYDRCYVIVWDGCKSGQTISKDFIEIIIPRTI